MLDFYDIWEDYVHILRCDTATRLCGTSMVRYYQPTKWHYRLAYFVIFLLVFCKQLYWFPF
jgi:hypothetical protein